MKINYAAAGFVLALLTLGASLVVQWTVNNEARAIAVARDLEQNTRIEKAEARVLALETNRSIEQQLAQMNVSITGRLASVETSVAELLRRDVRGRRE